MRMKSEGDIYHIIIRGTGRQIIFEDDADRTRNLHRPRNRFESIGAHGASASGREARRVSCLTDTARTLCNPLANEEMTCDTTMKSIMGETGFSKALKYN